MSSKVTIFEVGPRDGLQNESFSLTLHQKLEFVTRLVQAGISELELGSFVRTDRVPQMSDTEDLYGKVRNGNMLLGSTRAWALVPNLKGLERALESGVKQIAVFTAATDGFNQANIGMTVDQSFEEIVPLVRAAKRAGMKVRGYVSTAFGCPYEGRVDPKRALKVVERLAKAGVFQVSIGDTIGVATPRDIEKVMRPALRMLGAGKVAGHYHDTRGTALANVLRSLDLGVRTFDSSAGGLGGCPFAPGAAGNLATEDLVYMLNGMGLKSGVDLDQLAETSIWLAREMRRAPTSRYVVAYARSKKAANEI